MIHLGDGELDPVPSPSAIDRDGESAIVRNDHAIAVGRVDPHVVVVPAGTRAAGLDVCVFTAIQRHAERGRKVIRLVLGVRRHGHAGVIVSAPGQIAIVAHQTPVLAAVVRTPEYAAVGFLFVPRNAAAGFDQRVNPIGIGASDGDRNPAHRTRRQPAACEALPTHAAVAGNEETAPRPAAFSSPGVDFELPHAGEENPRIVRIHGQVRAACVFVHKKRFIPGLAAVGGPEDATLLLWTVGMPECARTDDVRIAGINDDAADPASLLETHGSPGLSRVGGFVYPVADRDMAANKGLAGSCPDYVRVGGSNG